MSSEELFFQSLGINDLTAYQNYKIKEVLLDEKKREFNVVMMLPDDLSPQDVDKLYQACKRGINGNIKVNLTIESLIYAKALDTFKINHKTMINMLEEVLRYAIVCDDLDPSLVEKPILKIEDEFDDKTLMNQELNVYGFYVSNHPASKYNTKDIVKINNVKNYLGKNVKMVVLINDIRKIKTKKNEDMAFVNGTDETGSMDFVVFPKKISYLENLMVGSLVVVMGTVARRIDKYQININVVRSI